jgi:hypothetical protein
MARCQQARTSFWGSPFPSRKTSIIAASLSHFAAPVRETSCPGPTPRVWSQGKRKEHYVLGDRFAVTFSSAESNYAQEQVAETNISDQAYLLPVIPPRCLWPTRSLLRAHPPYAQSTGAWTCFPGLRGSLSLTASHFSRADLLNCLTLYWPLAGSLSLTASRFSRADLLNCQILYRLSQAHPPSLLPVSLVYTSSVARHSIGSFHHDKRRHWCHRRRPKGRGVANSLHRLLSSPRL